MTGNLLHLLTTAFGTNRQGGAVDAWVNGPNSGRAEA